MAAPTCITRRNQSVRMGTMENQIHRERDEFGFSGGSGPNGEKTAEESSGKPPDMV